MIRPEQIETAKNMLNPPQREDGKGNTVMQLNMGEGKTSVIVPLLCASLAQGKNLVQITVLKSLFNMNYSYLASRLANILDRRVYVFPFNRNMKITSQDLENINWMLNNCMR
jgi:hypothetical protein